MGVSPFEDALDKLLKPLRFAASDGFTHLERVSGLPQAVVAGVERVLALAIPGDAREALAKTRLAFAVPLEGSALRAAVEAALARLAPFENPAWCEAALARSPAALPGVGPKGARALASRDIASVMDLLLHLPARWDDRRALAQVGELQVGRHASFVAKVLGCDFVATRGRFRGRGRGFEAIVGDETGTVTLKWFRSGESIAKQVRKDATLLVTGDVKRYRFSKQLTHPEIEVLAGDDPDPSQREDLRSITPDYSAPEGIHPRAMRRAVQHAVDQYADLLAGHLPAPLVRKLALPEPAQALRELHQPSVESDIAALRAGASPAYTRLVLEELYLLELGLALRREGRAHEAAIPIAGDGRRAGAAIARLPFRLTRAQQKVWAELRADLARPHPMQRLLEGDVGSGKTVIALLAAIAVAEAGCQTALMAPTELLAEQHERTLHRLADYTGRGAPLRIALLTASVPRAATDAIRTKLAAGEIDLVVGTHALVQEGVGFHRLALVVIDEQHRFGVRQRAALARKAAKRPRSEAKPSGGGPPQIDAAGDRAPHTLVMTATPIPRTLALTLYGDLDLSVLDELPPGRKPARTLLFREGQGARVTELVREAVARGEQVYVVYPLVEESEKLDLRAASESAEKLARAFPQARVDLVHGRLDAAARAAAMARFEKGETQILVSTTVIEVGVDVPNATLMVVEHAERFGLAQLHQLRGRVGRGARPGTCALVSRGGGEGSEARLAALLETSDGFAIAEADLRQRGPGEFLGTRQHGVIPDLRIADLARDVKRVAQAREAALETVRRDPGLRRAPKLLRAVQARWGDRLVLAGVG
jgi:ATP-dependent DNA helicase RecG